MTTSQFHNDVRRLVLCLAVFLLGAAAVSAENCPRERLSLNQGWRFTKGDPDGLATNQLSYGTLKPWLLPAAAEFSTNAVVPDAAARPAGDPGAGVAFAQPDFNDSQWRLLNLPHDWGIEGPFAQENPGDTGKLPWWGVGWYRQHLNVPAADQNRRLYLDVDGAMSYATVWVNGHLAGGWPYGYASWRVELTPFLKFGADNVIAIRLDNPKRSSRWYPGGGIYRNVWLVKTAPVHIAHWGTAVTTPEITDSSATVQVRYAVENSDAAAAAVTVKHDIYELKEDGSRGHHVAGIPPVELKLAGQQSLPATASATLKHPRLWSIEKPQLYVLVTTIMENGATVDTYESPFGIRTLTFTVDNGFLLNGQRVPLQGVCDHHDLGALGAALNYRALERQVQELKAMGCNAIRTSHNPPAPELLEICDRLGLVVMDEAFDCWATGKNANDYHLLYSDWHAADLRMLVRRDRNHPCVILWSSGNEVPDQDKYPGIEMAAEHATIIHSEDPTRPATAAVSSYKAGFSGFQNEFNVFGWNYKPTNYGKFRTANPKLPLFGSETASCISSRGEYFFPVSNDKKDGRADFQVSSYDLCAPPWATPPDTEFRGQDGNPFVAGEFVWTGFDYLGEPTPYNNDTSNLLNFTDPAEKARLKAELDKLGKIRVPSRSSYFGIIDLAGFPKDRYYIYQARWRPELPMAHILPHWNWPGREGQVTPVHVYTSGDSAELFLNGKSLGLKKKGQFEYRLRWDDVLYQPGELKVVAYKNGRQWATDTVKTTGPATQLLLAPDRKKIAADGADLSFVTVTIADQDGLLVPRTKNHIRFQLDGPGEIVATDNGDATSFESFQAPEHNAFNGLALVIVRGQPGHPGKLHLTATADGLTAATAVITTR